MNPDELAKQLGGVVKTESIKTSTQNPEGLAQSLGGVVNDPNDPLQKEAMFHYLTGNENKVIESGQVNFLERLKLSFGGQQAEERRSELESQAGLKGKLDWGDIADVGGSIVPFIGGLLGAAGGTVAGFGVGGIGGAAIGTGAGVAVKQAIGRGLGVREDIGLGKEITDIGVSAGLTYVLGKAGQYVISRIPKLLGILTGEGDDAIRQAISNPKAADLGIQKGDEALRQVVNTGAQKSIDLRNGFVRGYNEAFKQLSVNYPDKLVKRSTVWTELENLLGNKGVKITNKGLDFSTSKIKANPGEITKIQNVWEALKKWNDFSLEGVNKLKQLVGALTKFPTEAGGYSKSPTLGQYYHSLNDLIKNNLPIEGRTIYEELNGKFVNNIDVFDDMVSAFNSGEPFTRLANSLGRNKDAIRQIIQFYETKSGENVLSVVAGRELGAEKNAAFGILNPRSWIDFFWSPQMQGRFITRTGKIVNPIEETLKKGYSAYQSFLGVK